MSLAQQEGGGGQAAARLGAPGRLGVAWCVGPAGIGSQLLLAAAAGDLECRCTWEALLGAEHPDEAETAPQLQPAPPDVAFWMPHGLR